MVSFYFYSLSTGRDHGSTFPKNLPHLPLYFFQNPAMLSNDEDSSLDGSKVL